jgi:hypothetical protein
MSFTGLETERQQLRDAVDQLRPLVS